jgi:hypothetical protein
VRCNGKTKISHTSNPIIMGQEPHALPHQPTSSILTWQSTPVATYFPSLVSNKKLIFLLTFPDRGLAAL